MNTIKQIRKLRFAFDITFTLLRLETLYELLKNVKSKTKRKPEIDNEWCYNFDSGRIYDHF